MSRIATAFYNKKAFIPFITAGDPSIEVTEQLILGMAEAGADLIEIGIPFSDPVAEGSVIQEASCRALQSGTTADLIFDMVARIRRSSEVPLAFMTYANPVYTYGIERFLANCKKSGVDALIIPDVPFEEKEEFKPFCDHYGITMISMVAPTSKDRIIRIAEEAEGFLYCVSSLGVTGVRSKIGTEAKAMIELVKEIKDIPCAIGFGISTPEQVTEVSAFCDGVIVGSAIVKLIARYGNGCIPYVTDYIRELKEALH